MSTTKAIKKLYKAIVGSAPGENINSAAKLISSLADKWSTSVDKELPTVTAEDNGKILAVSSGKWEKASAPVELPTYAAADSGKVLAVKSDGTLEWKTLA